MRHCCCRRLVTTALMRCTFCSIAFSLFSHTCNNELCCVSHMHRCIHSKTSSGASHGSLAISVAREQLKKSPMRLQRRNGHSADVVLGQPTDSDVEAAEFAAELDPTWDTCVNIVNCLLYETTSLHVCSSTPPVVSKAIVWMPVIISWRTKPTIFCLHFHSYARAIIGTLSLTRFYIHDPLRAQL